MAGYVVIIKYVFKLSFQPNLKTGIEYGNKAFIFQSKKNKKKSQMAVFKEKKMLLYNIFPPLYPF